MQPSPLTSFNVSGPPTSEPLDATSYCLFLVLTVLCFWKFQDYARLYRNFVRCTTQDTQAEQGRAKFLEYLFLFLTGILFDLLYEGSEGFVYTSISVITFCAFIYVYMENMGYLSTIIQPQDLELDRGKLFTLYERKKFELSFYLNELALYKFVLERQQNTRLEEDRFQEKHTEICCKCLKAIQDLDNLICDLELNEYEDVQGYLSDYNRHSTVMLHRSTGFWYQLNSN